MHLTHSDEEFPSPSKKCPLLQERQTELFLHFIQFSGHCLQVPSSPTKYSFLHYKQAPGSFSLHLKHFSPAHLTHRSPTNTAPLKHPKHFSGYPASHSLHSPKHFTQVYAPSIIEYPSRHVKHSSIVVVGSHCLQPY